MNEIIAILNTLSPHLTSPLKHMNLLVEAMLSMTGRVTMLSLSRWTAKGGSYRTVQRFFKEKIDWSVLRWQLIKQHTRENKGVYLLIGDEVMVFMVTFSQLLLAKTEGINKGSMLDLKTTFRAQKYTRRIINSLGKNSEEFLIDNRIFHAAEIGGIHAKTA